MGTTWGLTGPQFLLGYCAGFAALLLLAVIVRAWPKPPVPTPVRLTDEELGFLAGGPQRAFLVATGGLRREDALMAGPTSQLQVAPQASAATPVRAAVLASVRAGRDGPALMLDERVIGALRAVRDDLAGRGLLFSRERQRVLTVLVVLLGVLWIVGSIRTAVGWAEAAPTSDLTLIQVFVLVGLLMFRRVLVRPQTQRADRIVAEVRRARIEPGADRNSDHRFGSRTVLAGVAGVPLALGGAAVLTGLDPVLATSIQAHRLSEGGWSGSGSTSTSSSCGGSYDSGSSSSCGGESSCGGGGGCGGGCGGGSS